jgi:hypothetical protein
MYFLIDVSAVLDAFAKLLKATVGFVTCAVRPSAWNNSIPTEPIFMKIHTGGCFRKYVEKIQVTPYSCQILMKLEFSGNISSFIE